MNQLISALNYQLQKDIGITTPSSLSQAHIIQTNKQFETTSYTREAIK